MGNFLYIVSSLQLLNITFLSQNMFKTESLPHYLFEENLCLEGL